MLDSLIAQCGHGSPSYNDLAADIENRYHADPSRQAVAQRLNKDFENFIEAILGQIMTIKTKDEMQSSLLDPSVFRGYGRVLVQDSTVIKLPTALFDIFSGVSNAHSSVCNARVQAVYDLRNGRLVSFSIDPYSKNDLKAAPELQLMEGDLVLRDRGYLTAEEMARHIEAAAHFIYRHKTGTTYLDPQTHKPNDLPPMLKQSGKLDIEVLLNNDQRTSVRLVVAPVSKEVADLRRMRAKKETKGHNPSQAVLELMDWTIYLTNIPTTTADFRGIFGIYGLRWRIEVIFKAWKSHLKFDDLHQVSERQLQIILKTRLLLIAAASSLYQPLERAVWKKHRKRLSLLKFMKYLGTSARQLWRVIQWSLAENSEREPIENALARYCCYDKRQKRLNFSEMWESLA